MKTALSMASEQQKSYLDGMVKKLESERGCKQVVSLLGVLTSHRASHGTDGRAKVEHTLICQALFSPPGLEIRLSRARYPAVDPIDTG